MAHSVNDNFVFRDLIKNKIGIRRCGQAPDHGIIRADADVRMKQKKVNNSLNTSLNAFGSLR